MWHVQALYFDNQRCRSICPGPTEKSLNKHLDPCSLRTSDLHMQRRQPTVLKGSKVFISHQPKKVARGLPKSLHSLLTLSEYQARRWGIDQGCSAQSVQSLVVVTRASMLHRERPIGTPSPANRPPVSISRSVDAGNGNL